MSLRLGSKVRLLKDAPFIKAGATGRISDIDYGSTFDQFTVTWDEGSHPYGKAIECANGSLLKEDLERIPGDRKVGEDIDPEDIRIGDKIYTYGEPDKGVERPTIGIVARINEEGSRIGTGSVKHYTHLIFNTKEGGTIYSTWWGSKNRVKLLEAQPHPVDAAQKGDSFGFTLGSQSILFTKHNDKVWIREVSEEGKPDSAVVRYADEVKSIFDDNGCVMQ